MKSVEQQLRNFSITKKKMYYFLNQSIMKEFLVSVQMTQNNSCLTLKKQHKKQKAKILSFQN